MLIVKSTIGDCITSIGYSTEEVNSFKGILLIISILASSFPWLGGICDGTTSCLKGNWVTDSTGSNKWLLLERSRNGTESYRGGIGD